jgi:hypothetical protein
MAESKPEQGKEPSEAQAQAPAKGRGRDSVPLQGKLQVVLKDGQGRVKKSFQVSNLVVTAGRELIASLLAQDGSSFPSHMAVGTSATSPSLGDSALLGTELGRVALGSTTASGKDVTYVATFPSGTATGTIEEMGIFNDGTSGTMLSRVLTGTIDKGSDDSLEITWTVTIG